MKNEVQVIPTKSNRAYTIRIVICGRVFNTATGNAGLSYEQAIEEAKEIADRMSVDFTPCEQGNTSIDKYPVGTKLHYL